MPANPKRQWKVVAQTAESDFFKKKKKSFFYLFSAKIWERQHVPQK